MSSIKLKHSGGNGVIIAAPSSNPASDRTLTLPADADGTILTSNSSVGKIIQVVNATTQTEAESTSTTFLDTNLTGSITPTAASSKIIITISQQLALNTSDSGNGGRLNINRKVASGSFSVIEEAPANSFGPFSFFISHGGATTTNYHFRHNMTHVDTPTYTLGDAITYKTQMRLYATGTSVRLRAQDSAADVNVPTSHIVLMEVAA